jgi:hypothetical protein
MRCARDNEFSSMRYPLPQDLVPLSKKRCRLRPNNRKNWMGDTFSCWCAEIPLLQRGQLGLEERVDIVYG